MLPKNRLGKQMGSTAETGDSVPSPLSRPPWPRTPFLAERATMHDDRDPFRAPAREPKPGTFHRPAHGFGTKRGPEAAELRLSGPMSGEQKLGDGLWELPLVGSERPTLGRP